MSAFTSTEINGTIVWAGDPDEEAGHAQVLDWIRQTGQTFLPAGTIPSPRIVGNIAEMIVFQIGREHDFQHADIYADAVNAAQPLSDISNAGVDILWMRFGVLPQDDWVCLQEVKATGDASLKYANELLQDYDKLFDADPRFTLRTRLDGLKHKLETQWNRPELASRLVNIGGPSPSQAARVRIAPSIVHEAQEAHPSERMATIRQGLTGRGWPGELVLCWAVKLDGFAARMERLIVGE